MPRLAPQHYRVLIKVFEKAGFVVKRTRGSHIIMNKAGVDRPIVIPKYDEVDIDINPFLALFKDGCLVFMKEYICLPIFATFFM